MLFQATALLLFLGETSQRSDLPMLIPIIARDAFAGVIVARDETSLYSPGSGKPVAQDVIDCEYACRRPSAGHHVLGDGQALHL